MQDPRSQTGIVFTPYNPTADIDRFGQMELGLILKKQEEEKAGRAAVQRDLYNLDKLTKKFWQKDSQEIDKARSNVERMYLDAVKKYGGYSKIPLEAFRMINEAVDEVVDLANASLDQKAIYTKWEGLLSGDKTGVYDREDILQNMGKYASLPINERVNYDYVPVPNVKIDIDKEVDQIVKGLTKQVKPRPSTSGFYEYGYIADPEQITQTITTRYNTDPVFKRNVNEQYGGLEQVIKYGINKGGEKMGYTHPGKSGGKPDETISGYTRIGGTTVPTMGYSLGGTFNPTIKQKGVSEFNQYPKTAVGTMPSVPASATDIIPLTNQDQFVDIAKSGYNYPVELIGEIKTNNDRFWNVGRAGNNKWYLYGQIKTPSRDNVSVLLNYDKYINSYLSTLNSKKKREYNEFRKQYEGAPSKQPSPAKRGNKVTGKKDQNL